MIEKLISAIVAMVLAAAAVWWFNDSIRDYYQKPLIESYAEAQRLAKKQTETRAASNDKLKKEAENAKIKQLESNLAAANAAANADAGLRDALRAGRIAANSNLSACAQYADTVTVIFATGADLARRIAAEADGHVADKIACATAWPK
jgi:hypothetical protein